MNQTTISSDTLPPANPPRWIAHGHGRIWYPVLVVLNVLLVSFLFYYIWRIMSKKANRVDGTEGSISGTASSSLGSLLPSPSAHVRLHSDVLSPRSVFVYSAAGEEKLDCAVCLAEFRDLEKGRQLPRCGHKFHAACIDVWFRSHNTCPICRSSMEQTTAATAATTTPAAAETASVPAEAV